MCFIDMNHISAKQYLEQLEIIDINIRQELERIEEMRSDASLVAAVDYTKDRVQTGPVNVLEKKVCNYIVYEERLNQRIGRFFDIREKIISEIRGLHNKNHIQILFKVYVQYKSIRQAAKEMNMSYAYVIELHKTALQSFSDTYQKLHYLS